LLLQIIRQQALLDDDLEGNEKEQALKQAAEKIEYLQEVLI